MELPEEIESLRVEQRRLRDALERIDTRIENMDRRLRADADPRPAALIADPVSEATPPPLPTAKPAFDEVVSVVTAPEPEPAVAADSTSTFVLPPLAEEPAPPRVEAPRESFELRLGRVWLARLGIVILLTGLVFLGNYAYHEFIARVGPIGKLLLIYLAGGGLCGLGAWLARREENVRNYSRVLLAGGCATIYYATYAAHFVGMLRVIESPLAAGLLLLALGGGFVALANRIRSQTLAAATIALAFYTSAINPVGTFSLFSNLVISATAIVLLARRRSASVSFLSLVGAYGSFAFWRFHQSNGFPSFPSETAFWPAVLFPAAYWLVHTAAVMLRRVSALDPAAKPVFLTLNNAAFFALAGPVIAAMHPDCFWICTALYGTALIALSLIVARRTADEPWFDGSYLAQGVGLILLALLYKFTGWQQAISFALLGATLVSMGRMRHGVVLRCFAGVCAIVSAWGIVHMLIHDAPHARLTAGGIAVIHVISAWLMKRQSQSRCDWRVLGFALLSAAIAVPACADSHLLDSATRILAVALAAMLAARVLRLPEFAYASQPLAFFGQAMLLVHAASSDVPTSTLLLSAAFALANIHLLQWQSGFALAGRKFWQSLHIIVPIMLALWWTMEHLTRAQQGPILALAGLLLLGYGSLTRTGVLQFASAVLTASSIGCAANSIGAPDPWISPALTMLLLAAQSFVLSRIITQPAPVLLLRASALFIGFAMVFAYVAEVYWFLTFTGAALALFLVVCLLRRDREALFYAGLVFGIAVFSWVSRLPSAPAQGIDLLGFAAIALAQRVGRRRLADTNWFPAEIQAALCSAAVLGVWITIHRLVAPSAGGFLLTISWSLLAFLVMGCGFILRERVYRVLGLIILAAAVGRIFCIDVWQLETIYRIVSFLVLGGVLLVLGFLYNRHADALRRWL